jgi:DNA (cytosine-5)-methyltransferase 1
MNTISLFSGAMGLDLGLEQAGFKIVVAVECDPVAVRTIKKNRPSMNVIAKEIQNVPTNEMLAVAGLKRSEITCVVGGPCCQSFSTAGSRGSMTDPRGNLFREFVRVVREVKPRFFVMENVKGMLSAAVRHRPLKERGDGFPPLEEDEKLGSGFRVVLEELKSLGYFIRFSLCNAADYGVPQSRERVIIIGSRDGENVLVPLPTHCREGGDGLKKWTTLRSAIGGIQNGTHEYPDLSDKKKKFLKLIPEGKNWQALPAKMQKDAIGGAYDSWGGRSGFLRRLDFSKPSPALVTSPNGNATLLGHPTELRPLSVQEYAKIQQFPADWEFCGSLSARYRQIGNAVPIGFGKAIGEALRKAMRSKRKGGELGTVECQDKKLAKRLRELPITYYNPWQTPKAMPPVKVQEGKARAKNPSRPGIKQPERPKNNRAAMFAGVYT